MYIKEINVDMIGSPFEMPTATAEIVTNNVTVVRKDIMNDIMNRAELAFTYARSGVGCRYALQIKEVIFNEPATIVYWTDGTKTVVKCGSGDTFDKEKGLALCCMKKMFGNKGNYNNTLKKYIGEEK